MSERLEVWNDAGPKDQELLSVDKWPELKPSLFRYLQRLVQMHANHAAIGVIELERDRQYQVWRMDTINRQRRYLLLVEFTKDNARPFL